jgi:hypothetical protein
VATDLFISYRWTSHAHRQWVRLLAAAIKALGYYVLIDEDVDYGDSLTGFMRQAMEARHVLMIADDAYVQRADTTPDSGVGIENRHISSVYDDRPPGWLSVMYKDNGSFVVPAWLADRNPKGFDFNAEPEGGNFPGSLQFEEVLRWLDDLPASKNYAVPVHVLRERAARIERIDVQRDPAAWRSPASSGTVYFEYNAAPGKTYLLGHGDSEFAFKVSRRTVSTVAVYADPVKAIGVVRAGALTGRALTRTELASHLRAGRVVDAGVGDSVLLMNDRGMLCRMEIHAVHPEVETSTEYVPAHVQFDYEILQDS